MRTITINFPKMDTNSIIRIVTSTNKLICLNLLGRTRNFWGKPEFQPIWWPEDVSFDNISRKSTKSIL